MADCDNCKHYVGDDKLCVETEYTTYYPCRDLSCLKFEPKSPVAHRTFSTGAIRDTDAGKPNYIKALSPIVLRGYVEYLGKHRQMSDGMMRDWDNWKSGLPKEVCLESLGRHNMAVWLLMQGFPAFDNHGPVTLEDSLYAVIFNVSCILHELLRNDMQENRTKPVPGGY